MCRQHSDEWRAILGFPIDELPNDDRLALAIDVKSVDKWGSEKPRKRYRS